MHLTSLTRDARETPLLVDVREFKGGVDELTPPLKISSADRRGHPRLDKTVLYIRRISGVVTGEVPVWARPAQGLGNPGANMGWRFNVSLATLFRDIS